MQLCIALSRLRNLAQMFYYCQTRWNLLAIDPRPDIKEELFALPLEGVLINLYHDLIAPAADAACHNHALVKESGQPLLILKTLALPHHK